MSIVFEPIGHTYKDGDRVYTSVTQVIAAVIRKDIDGVDPAVLANAAERGIRTEAYATEILKTGYCTIVPGERQDVLDRVECFYRWYEAEKPTLVQAQQIVKDDPNGIAGQLDWLISTERGVGLLDCKCTASLDKVWPIQVGAYSWMTDTMHNFAGVLHINPKFAKGWIWREYDINEVQSHWRTTLAFYNMLKVLKTEA